MRASWMKTWVAAVWLTTAGVGAAVDVDTSGVIEQEIRRLDALEADAVLRGDFARIDELWAEDFIVNNPGNAVGFGREGPVMTGGIAYSSFDRVVEFVALRGDVAIVMGHEQVVPKAPSELAGQTLQRRFTNVWMKTRQGWRLAARHANVIPGTRAP